MLINPKTNQGIHNFNEQVSKPDQFMKQERKALLVGEMIDYLWANEQRSKLYFEKLCKEGKRPTDMSF